MKKDPSLKIGEVSQKVSCSTHTLRYYEKRRLIHAPKRTQGGFRLYSAETIEKILFIKKAQGFGLSLREIKKIMSCSDKGFAPCCSMITQIFENKILEFERQITELQTIKKRLRRLLSTWVKK